jgi:rhodanese-related sulfurtransferase
LHIEIKKIFLVLVLSSIVGLIFNNFNPEGISLIRQVKNLSFASDSLIISEIIQNEKETEDSVDITTQLEIIENEQRLSEEINDTIMQENTVSLNDESEIFHNNQEVNEEKIFVEPKVINLEQAYILFNNGAKFIDAREDIDYNEGHISKAINIYFYSFEENENKLNGISKDEAIVTYCNGTDCDLSVLLGNKLAEIGYKNVFVFFGGWLDWVKASYPTTTNGTIQ